MREKKLLAILSRYLWPVDGGRKESLIHYFKELHDNYGYQIRILCFLEAGQVISEQDIPYFIDSIEALKDPSISEKVFKVVTKSFGPAKWPFQCSLFSSVENMNRISDEMERWNPDVVFTEMIRTCTYYPAIKRDGVLLLANIDDLLSKRYRRQISSRKAKSNFTGSYGGKISGVLGKLLNLSFLKNTVLRMESIRCEKWEKKYYELFDYTLLTSSVESDSINQIMQGNKAKTLSVGIDYSYYSENNSIDKEENSMSFLGNFNVAANADTLEMIVNEVLPKLTCPYRLYLIGTYPAEIAERYKENKNIVFCGRVDDLRKHIKKTQVFLSPIAYGTGIKTKIIEAMAMGMPVVTNSVGSEGINARSGYDYYVDDSTDKIAEYVELIFQNKDVAATMGRNAELFAKQNFNWEKVLSVYKEMNL